MYVRRASPYEFKGLAHAFPAEFLISLLCKTFAVPNGRGMLEERDIAPLKIDEVSEGVSEAAENESNGWGRSASASPQFNENAASWGEMNDSKIGDVKAESTSKDSRIDIPRARWQAETGWGCDEPSGEAGRVKVGSLSRDSSVRSRRSKVRSVAHEWENGW